MPHTHTYSDRRYGLRDCKVRVPRACRHELQRVTDEVAYCVRCRYVCRLPGSSDEPPTWLFRLASNVRDERRKDAFWQQTVPPWLRGVTPMSDRVRDAISICGWLRIEPPEWVHVAITDMSRRVQKATKAELTPRARPQTWECMQCAADHDDPVWPGRCDKCGAHQWRRC